jgi:hypothetical protein
MLFFPYTVTAKSNVRTISRSSDIQLIGPVNRLVVNIKNLARTLTIVFSLSHDNENLIPCGGIAWKKNCYLLLKVRKYASNNLHLIFYRRFFSARHPCLGSVNASVKVAKAGAAEGCSRQEAPAVEIPVTCYQVSPFAPGRFPARRVPPNAQDLGEGCHACGGANPEPCHLGRAPQGRRLVGLPGRGATKRRSISGAVLGYACPLAHLA